jgi:hypothetical protein
MRLFLSIVLGAGCVCAQSGIEVPAVGVIVDSSGALRQVQGVAGSFFLAPPSVPGVFSAACSEQLCLVKTDSKILSATGETDAPPGPAIFGFSGDGAIVFFPEARAFARWHNDVVEPLDWAVDGEVLSVRSSEIAIRKDGAVSLVHADGSLADGSVADSIADASGPVLLIPKGVVFATNNEIVLRQDDSEVRFELADAQSITAMGSRYVAICAGGAIYALRIDAGRESLFLLPGIAQ